MSIHICMDPFFGDIPMMHCLELFLKKMAHNEQNSLWIEKTTKKTFIFTIDCQFYIW
jgi:hypothetical protein